MVALPPFTVSAPATPSTLPPGSTERTVFAAALPISIVSSSESPLTTTVPPRASTSIQSAPTPPFTVKVLPAFVERIETSSAPLPALSLTLEPAAIGLSTRTGACWRERCSSLLTQFGPCGLAFLESLLRAADVRASRLRTNDPALQQEVSQ